MNQFPKIEGSSCSRFNNAMHAGFHRHMLEVFSTLLEDLRDKLNLTEAILDVYEDCVDVEEDNSQQVRASTITLQMADSNTERDRLLSVVIFIVMNALKSTNLAVKKAAQALEVVIRRYKGTQGKADETKTSLIRGLLIDLRKAEMTSFVTALDLEPVLEDLEEANEAFDRAKKTRKSEQEAKSGTPTDEARARTDRVYQNICILVSAAAISASAEDLEFIVSIIGEMNAVIAEYKKSFNQSEAQKKANKEENPDPEKPEEGGEGGLEFVPVDDEKK